MRAEEVFAMKALVSKYGGEFTKGEDPPDGYIIKKHKRIAVEVTRLIQHVSTVDGASKSRLGDDAPAINLANHLDNELTNRIPEDKFVLLIIRTPLLNVRKFKKELPIAIIDLIEGKPQQKTASIASNDVTIKVYSGKRDSGKKVIAAIANSRSSADIHSNARYILDKQITVKETKREELDGVSEYWLAFINEYWIADAQTYKRAYDSLCVKHGFDKVLVINETGEVIEIY